MPFSPFFSSDFAALPRRGLRGVVAARRGWLIVWLVSACAPRDAKAPEPSTDAVTFVKAAPRVGRISVEETTIELRLDSEARASGRPPTRVRTRSVERERRREEVLAVFERIVIKKKVIYETLERLETRDGVESAAAPSPLAGRSYVVELIQSAPVFTDPLGHPVSDVEEQELARRLPRFGKADPFVEGIPDGPIRPGVVASGLASGFLQVFDSGEEGPDVGDVNVRFAGSRDEPEGRCGIFAFKVRAQIAGEPRVDVDLGGEFLVRISDAAPIRFDARGPVRLVGFEEAGGASIQLRGAGEMKGSFRVTYL
jgi:hypothetical protein